MVTLLLRGEIGGRDGRGEGGASFYFFIKKKYYESLINENSKRVINYSMLPIL